MKDIKDFQLVPYSAQRHYAPLDTDDPNTPFVESIPLDKTDEDAEGLETRTNDNARVQKINLYNVTFADAFLKGALTAKKKEDD